MQFTVKCIEFPTRAYQIIFNRDIKQTFIYRSNSKNNQNWAQQTTAMNTGFHGNGNHWWIFTNLLNTSTVCMLLNPDTIPLIPSKLCGHRKLSYNSPNTQTVWIYTWVNH